MQLVRIRVRENIEGQKHMWCERWWTRVWVMTPREHYPPHIWDRLMGHHALEIEATEDGTNWERIWPKAVADPTPARSPEPKKEPAPKPKPVKPPEPKYIAVCERCGKELSEKDISAKRKNHWRCPGSKKSRNY